MRDYHINVFWSDEDDCYVADIPDLEYCSAFGDTPQEAVEQVLIAKDRGSSLPARMASLSRLLGTAPPSTRWLADPPADMLLIRSRLRWAEELEAGAKNE